MAEEYCSKEEIEKRRTPHELWNWLNFDDSSPNEAMDNERLDGFVKDKYLET
jgi:hypothetical protein